MNLLGKAKQDGEIKIRLKPDHLGELRMNVRTDGQKVSLQIHAQDGNSKKIIEESLGALKDGLSNHQLLLSSVEVAVTQAVQGSIDPQMNMDMGSFRQHTDSGSSGHFGQQSSEQRGFSSPYGEGSEKTGLTDGVRPTGRPLRNDSGRLDLIA